MIYLKIGFIVGCFLVGWLFLFNKENIKDYLGEIILILILSTCLWGLILFIAVMYLFSKISNIFKKEYCILLIPLLFLTCITVNNKPQIQQQIIPQKYERTIYKNKYNKVKKNFPWINTEIYSIIKKESLKNNINENLIIALIDVESSGNPYATGKSGDIDLMKVIAKFYYKGNPYELYIPKKNINTGTKYLAYCLARAGQKNTIACIYYNAGAHTNIKNYKRWWYINRILKNIKNLED